MTAKHLIAIVGPYLLVAVGAAALYASHSPNANVALVGGLALALMNHKSVYLPPPGGAS